MGIVTSLVRVIACKLIHTLWPAKDVFAAGIVEVDIRPVEIGQNFVVKWRSKPVFIRRRSPEMIAASQKDDVIVASMRDPETDADRCKNPEWLICIGVYPSWLHSATRRWQLGRLLLPLPWLSLRPCWPHSSGSCSEEL